MAILRTQSVTRLSVCLHLIAQLVEYFIGIAKVMGSIPVQAWMFFFPRLWFQICLSAHIIKIFIFPSDPTFHAMNICEKNSIWIKSDFVMNVLKPENPIFLRSTRAADHSIDMLRVVT